MLNRSRRRLGQGLALEIGRQGRDGVVVRDEAAGIDVAVAHPVLQGMRHCQPASRAVEVVKGDSGPRRAQGAAAAPVHRQQMRPVLVAGLQRLLDQQAPEAGAVDEQVALDGRAGLQPQGGDEAGLGVLVDLDDLALGPLDAQPLGEAAQVLAVEDGVEMIGEAEGRHRIARVFALAVEPAGRGRLGAQRIVGQVEGPALLVQLQPVLEEVAHLGVEAVDAERVEIGLTQPAPVAELDAQLVGRLGLAHELGLIQAQHGVEQSDRRDRGLADADHPDVLGSATTWIL